MADNKNSRDGRDRSLVSGSDDYELRYISERFNVSEEEVRELIKEVGNSREKIEERLRGRERR